MKKVSQNKILIDRGQVKLLMEELKTSRPTVQRALDGTNVCTAMHMRIREKAIELGGIEIE